MPNKQQLGGHVYQAHGQAAYDAFLNGRKMGAPEATAGSASVAGISAQPHSPSKRPHSSFGIQSAGKQRSGRQQDREPGSAAEPPASSRRSAKGIQKQVTKKEKRGAEKEIWRTSTATRKRAGDGRAPSVSSLEEDDSKAVRRVHV